MDRKKLLKAVSIFLIIMMLGVIFTGCGEKKESSGSVSDKGTEEQNGSTSENSEASGDAEVTPLEPIKFVIWVGGPDPGSTGEEDPCHKYIREKLGVDIQFMYTPAGNEDDQLNLMLAGGDYPDAIIRKVGDWYHDWVIGGHLVELNEYLKKYCPELYAKMEKDKDAYDPPIDGYDGKFFFVPGGYGYSEEYPCIEPTLGFRVDIWKQLSDDPTKLPLPKDLEEFYEMAKQMQNKVPEYEGKKTYAFSGWFGDTWGVWAVYAIQRFGGSHNWVGGATQKNYWQQEYCFDSEEWMYAIKYLNRAYREGYADPEAVTMKYDQYVQKLAQGIIFINYYAGDWLDGQANAARAAAGHPEQRLVPYTWMKYPGYTGEQITGQYFPRPIGGCLFITKNCKDPEEIIKRLAWLATEEGRVFQGMGIEGVHWTKDENGFRMPTAEVIALKQTDNRFAEKTGIGKYLIFGWMYGGYDENGDAYVLHENKYFRMINESKYDREYKELLKQAGLDFINLDEPIEMQAARAGMTRDDNVFSWDPPLAGTEEAEIASQLETLQAEYVGKLYAAKSDEEFNKLVEEWKAKANAINYKKYYDFINPRIKEAYENYLKDAGKTIGQ